MSSYSVDFVTVCVVLCVLGSAASAGSYEYDPEYLLPSVCPECEAKSCPQLTYCAGVVVKDHCGCCNRCSSDLFQPHVQNTVDISEQPSVKPEEIPGDVCSKRKCPKFKVCVKNIQGLAICTCPSEFICRQKHSKRKGQTETTELCGSDGKTYLSRCHLKIANCNSQRRIKKNHDGPCVKSTSQLSALNTDKNVYTNINDNARNHIKDVTKTPKHRKKNRKQKVRNRKDKKDRKKKRNKKVKKEKKRDNRRRRSKRMKRRNKEGYMYPSNYGALAGRQPEWSRSQVRKSKI